MSLTRLNLPDSHRQQPGESELLHGSAFCQDTHGEEEDGGGETVLRGQNILGRSAGDGLKFSLLEGPLHRHTAETAELFCCHFLISLKFIGYSK